MAYVFPEALNRLISELSHLPGVGRKAAQRLAFHLLSQGKADCQTLAQAILEAGEKVHPCPICGNLTDQETCTICQDSKREQSMLCVVEQVSDLISMERSGSYHGLYHVLGGVISPMDGMGPEQLRLTSLGKRLQSGQVKELIMATNPTIEGEATAQFLAQKFRREGLTITRLAHGMPVGGALAFVDEATLDMAFSGRRPL